MGNEMQILKTIRACQLERLGREGPDSSNASTGIPPRTLLDLVTPEFTKLLRLVPAGLVAGVKDLAKDRLVETSTSGRSGGVECNVQSQQAQQWRPSSLFYLACTVLILINVPLLILVLFLFGPLVVVLFVACVLPLGLANIARCSLRDNNKGCRWGHKDERSESEIIERQEVVEISNRLRRTHTYISGLAGADYTALNTPPYSKLSVPPRPLGKSLEHLLSSLQKPLEGLCHWIQKMRPEISFKLSFKLAVQPEGSFNSLLRYPRGSGYFCSKFADYTSHEALPAPYVRGAVELLEAESFDGESLIHTSSAYDDDTLDVRESKAEQQFQLEKQPTSASKHTKHDLARPSASNETVAQAAGAANLEAKTRPVPRLLHSPSMPTTIENVYRVRERRTSTSSRDAETNGIELRQLLASRHSQARMTRLKQLLRMGANPNICNCTGATALHIAAWKGKGLEVMKLIEYGALVDVPDDCGLIPLHMAVWHRNLSAVSVLLQSGADVNALTNIKYGDFHSALTPLHFALLRECKLIVHMLLMARTRPPSEVESSQRQSIARSGSLPSLADLASSVQRDGCQTHMRVIESAMEYFSDGIWEELHPPRRGVTNEVYGRYSCNATAPRVAC